MKVKGWKRIATWILVVLFTAAMLFVLVMPLVYAADDGMAVYAANDGATVIGDGQMGDNVYWKLTADGVLTVYGTGATWDYESPWESDTDAWKYTMYNNQYVKPKYIVIEPGVTTIGEDIFGDMNELLSVKMADTVVCIKQEAFWDCDVLEKIELSSNLKIISRAAFAFCKKLDNVCFPAGLVEIGRGAFEECDALKNVYYSDTKTQWEKIKIGSGNDPLISANIGFNDSAISEPSAWAKAEVNAAIGAGLVPENLQKNYQTAVSRGEVAEMFVKLLEKSSGKTIDAILAEKGASANPGTFSDSSDKNVLASNALGIINGTGNGKFSPDGTLTRAQIAAIINRTANVLGVETKGYTHKFADVSGHWVSSELGWPAKAGIINGVGDNKFDPDGKLTTEQAIAITNRALNVLKK